MDTDITPYTKIRPLLTHAIHVKSLHTYNSFLVKRPKHTITFKFSRQGDLIQGDKENQIKSDIKLQKALSRLKSVEKVDLSKYQVKGEEISQNRFQYCFKHSISKASSLIFTRYQLYNNLGANFAERPLKHLSRLHNLVYEMIDDIIPRWVEPQKGPCTKDPLRYLRFCPNMKSLKIGTLRSDSGFSRIFSRLHKYSTSLKHITLEVPNKEEERGFAFQLKTLQRLESLYFKFDGKLSENSWAWNIDGLSSLENLQEIKLEFNMPFFPEIHPMLKRMAERKIMKKVRLIFPKTVPVNEETLKALQGFDQLTHFELRILIKDDETLKILLECLENRKQLQDLRLTLFKKPRFSSFDNLNALCQKIQNLQSLRHLHLSFGPFSSRIEIPNFILFSQPLNLETLSLAYGQLNPTRSFFDLAAALKDSLTSLRNLKIFFGSCSPDKNSQGRILESLSSFPHLQVLEMEGLEVEGDDFLIQIAQTIPLLKYLREFTLGEIREGVTPSVYENALETILSKRGLRKFECQTCDSLVESCGLTVSLFGEPILCRINMKRIEKKNPFLESVQISDHMFILDLLKETDYWA